MGLRFWLSALGFTLAGGTLFASFGLFLWSTELVPLGMVASAVGIAIGSGISRAMRKHRLIALPALLSSVAAAVLGSLIAVALQYKSWLWVCFVADQVRDLGASAPTGFLVLPSSMVSGITGLIFGAGLGQPRARDDKEADSSLLIADS
jgi:hypothetical protein